MTDEGQEMENSLTIYIYGFEQGRRHERNLITAWLRANVKGNVDPWSSAADAIKAGEHLK